MAFKMLSLGLALASLQASHGMRIPQKRQSTLTVFTLDGWQSLGCWSDSQSSRTLDVFAHSGEHVSDDNCQYQCTQLGYNYAGTEYSGQCYCDNQVNSIATQEADSDCNMACTGKPDQPCGGPNRINLFWNGKTAPAKPKPVTNPGVDNYISQGCWTDSVGSRNLGHAVDTAGGGSALTVKLCVDACSSAGYSLAGVEYSGQCYCDNTYSTGALASDQTMCNMVCNGNPSEYCGGAGAMNLYSLNDATPQAATPLVSTPVTPVTPSTPSSWTALGCYSDNVGKRALQNFFAAPSNGMTVETCIGLCSSNGYSIAGVEYGSECWCDNAVQNNQGLASDGSAGCNKPCSGNDGETCGGPNRLNVYAAGPGWVQLGCYTDQVYQRTLANTGAYTGGLTVEKCLASCHAAGYPYAGLEYGEQCFCGSSFDNGGGPAPDGNAGCSFTCSGSGSEICGGSQRLSMYEYINADGTVSSTASTGSTGSTGTTGSTDTDSSPSTPTSVTNGLPSGWAYQACYVDNTNGRILSVQQPDSASLTVESCINTCAAAGYSVAGVEYADQCFCGNAIINGGVPASSDVSSSQCHMACPGSTTESCGGPALMDIYATGSLATEAAPRVQTTNLPADWTYQECLSDNVGSRTLKGSHTTFGTTNDATACLNYCTEQGYSAAGLEYGQECWCGSPQDIFGSGSAQSTACTMTCSGDSSFLCGGPGALSYYTYTQPGKR